MHFCGSISRIDELPLLISITWNEWSSSVDLVKVTITTIIIEWSITTQCELNSISPHGMDKLKIAETHLDTPQSHFWDVSVNTEPQSLLWRRHYVNVSNHFATAHYYCISLYEDNLHFPRFLAAELQGNSDVSSFVIRVSQLALRVHCFLVLPFTVLILSM